MTEYWPTCCPHCLKAIENPYVRVKEDGAIVRYCGHQNWEPYERYWCQTCGKNVTPAVREVVDWRIKAHLERADKREFHGQT